MSLDRARLIELRNETISLRDSVRRWLECLTSEDSPETRDLHKMQLEVMSPIMMSTATKISDLCSALQPFFDSMAPPQHPHQSSRAPQTPQEAAQQGSAANSAPKHERDFTSHAASQMTLPEGTEKFIPILPEFDVVRALQLGKAMERAEAAAAQKSGGLPPIGPDVRDLPRKYIVTNAKPIRDQVKPLIPKGRFRVIQKTTALDKEKEFGGLVVELPSLVFDFDVLIFQPPGGEKFENIEKGIEAGMVCPDNVTVYGPHEKNDCPEANSHFQSQFDIFRRVAVQANMAVRYYARTSPTVIFQRFVTWCFAHENLFSQKCNICQKLVSYTQSLPYMRDFETLKPYHPECIPFVTPA